MSDNTLTQNPLVEAIQAEINANKVTIYSKGTAENPRCGFTMETAAFFRELGVPFVMIDVLEQPEKRQLLNQLYDWQTLPKVFINGEFYGDTDILNEMKANGELQEVLNRAFPDGLPAKAQ